MRQIVSLSLPENMVNEVEKVVKEKNYTSKSEFFRYLLRDWMENNLLEELNEGCREIASGKGKKLNSLKDI